MSENERILSYLENLTTKVECLTQDVGGLTTKVEGLTQDVEGLKHSVSKLEQGQDELRQGQDDANKRLANLELCYTSMQGDMITVNKSISTIEKKQERDSQKLEEIYILVQVLDAEHTVYIMVNLKGSVTRLHRESNPLH